MKAKDLIDRVTKHKLKHFIAPVLSKQAKLFVVQNSIPFWFHTEVEYPNWYYLQPYFTQVGKKPTATAIRQANPHEYINYMNELASFHVIALFPINDTVWLVMPYNISDAEQRGWKHGVPRSMYLTMDNIASMDVVVARLLPSHTLIFDHLAGLMPLGKKEFDMSRGIFEQRLEAVRKQEAKKKRDNKLQTEEGRLKESLKFMGAELEDWTRQIDGYTVRWSIDEQIYKTEIDTKMRVVSAGVCLSGTDDWHSLTSVVEVMRERASAIANDDHGDW